MDGQRFDAMTKALAVGTSRRAVLRTALGGMGAGLLAVVGAADAGATGKRNCAEACKQRFGPGRARGQCISGCAKGTLTCGGIQGLLCPEGFTCVDDPTDDCDPATGDADCLGVCQPACQSDADCGAREFCCNPSCGICAPRGGNCIQRTCP